MTKQNLKIYFLVSMMVFCAIVLRVLAKYDIWIVPGGIARSLIYIALYIGWGISVRNRIIQTQVRRYLISIAGLMASWFVIRSTKYYFTADITIERQLWYWYYLPMLLSDQEMYLLDNEPKLSYYCHNLKFRRMYESCHEVLLQEPFLE